MPLHKSRWSVRSSHCDDCFVAFSVIVLGSKSCGFAWCSFEWCTRYDLPESAYCSLIFFEGASLHFQKYAAPLPMHRNRFSGVSIPSLLLLSSLCKRLQRFQRLHYRFYTRTLTIFCKCKVNPVHIAFQWKVSISSIRFRMVN